MRAAFKYLPERAETETRAGEPVKGSPLTLPLPCGGRECRQQNLWTTTKHHPIGWCFFVCASALTVVSAGCRRPRFSAHCAIFRVVMTRKWGRRTRFRQNNRYFAFFLAMEKSMWYTGAEYNSECAGGLHRCGLGAPLLRAVAGNVCTHDRDPVHRRRRDIAAPHGGLTEPGRRP